MFNDLLEHIKRFRDADFETASIELVDFVDHDENFLETLKQIGTIPESIVHDSTEEKLFSKVSDAVLSRAFRELGLRSTVLKERADSADVFAESLFHGYSLVADAKAFRMSRTAKNQKDFKVAALSSWRKDYDYAVLCSPYHQFPSKSSQIYAQALDYNVCLLSWEHLIFLISNGVKETSEKNLSKIWSFSFELAQETVVAKKKLCFIPKVNQCVYVNAGLDEQAFQRTLEEQVSVLQNRADMEKSYWERELARIQRLTREQAVEELIKTKKINEKIAQIKTYSEGLGTW